jgi:ceramide glucosyltransferase
MNPKVNNLIRPFQVAKYDILWVIDSGIQVAPGTLARSVDALIHPPPSEIKAGKRMGIVHHVPFAISDAPDSFKCWGGRLEEAFLNTNHAKMYLALNALAIESCVVGKSNMYHRSDINQLTGALSKQETKSSSPRGLAAFGKFLAEDNMIAAALWHELDLAHTLSCDVVHNEIGDMTLWDYVQRRIRWIRVRKHIVLAATLLEPFQEFMLFTALSASAFVYLFGIPAWVFVLIHSFGWLYIDLDVYASLAGHPLPSSRRWGFLWSWFLRELLTLPIWVVAVAGNEVRWRGRSYRVVQNGEAQEVVDD